MLSGGLGIARPALLIAGVLLVVLVGCRPLVGVIGGEANVHSRSAREAGQIDPAILDRVASHIAQRRVTVTCDARLPPGVGGFAIFGADAPRDVAVIARRHCVDLKHAASVLEEEARCIAAGTARCSSRVDDAVMALHVLAHESFHLYGVREEPAADCYALQAVAGVAETIGVERRLAGQLLAYFARFFEPIRSAPASYRSPECRASGALDLQPQTPGWPG